MRRNLIERSLLKPDRSTSRFAIHLTGAQEHDNRSLDDLVIHLEIKRPNSEQHFCE